MSRLIKYVITVIMAMILISCSTNKKVGVKDVDADDVKYTESVYGKPCVYKGEERGPNLFNPVDIMEWHREKAASLGANTLIPYGYKSSDPLNYMSYFYCGIGIKPFTSHPSTVWIGSLKAGENASFEQIKSKCDYEVHKATLDLSRPPNERAIYYGNSNNAFLDFTNTINQLGAQQRDWANNIQRIKNIENAKIKLTDECYAAYGLELRYSNSKADVEAVHQYCNSIDNINKPCIIPRAK